MSTELRNGTRDPTKLDPPIPKTAKIIAIVMAVIAGIMAMALSYRLGFSPKDILGENFRDLVILNSALWVVTMGLLAIGTRPPKPPPEPIPPTPKEDQ